MGATRSQETDAIFDFHDGGKIEVLSRRPITTRDELSMAYTPGVADISNAIATRPELVRSLTIKGNCVAVVTDGSAVLGLGNIGPEAALPVMEGKAMLFKEFGGVDAFPICLATQDPEAIIETVERISPAFGGINLEDISSPRCFEIEDALVDRLDIPVFHDDQHGTAVVVLAALQNALQIAGKSMAEIKILIAGAGAAGVACARILADVGVCEIILVDRQGALCEGRPGLDLDGTVKGRMAQITNPCRLRGSLSDVICGADVFLGLSGPGVLTRDDVAKMAPGPIVFALSNPEPEIRPEAVSDLALITATGRSDYPNQINNVLCFPGLFRGLLDAGAHKVTAEMKIAAAQAIADCVSLDELSTGMIVPSVFNTEVARSVAKAVAGQSQKTRMIDARHRLEAGEVLA